MTQIALAGVAAGIAGALLFLSPLGGTLLAYPLMLLCGLPVAIAGLAWTPVAGAVATAVAGLAVAVALSLPGGGIYVLLFGGPVTWMCRLADLSRPGASEREWYPIGRVLFQGAVAVSVGLVIVGVIVGYDPEALTAEMSETMAGWLAQAEAAPPSAADLVPFVRFNVAALPFTLSALLVIVLVFNAWLGSRVAAASGRLSRPREPLWTAELPPEAGIAFIAAFVLAFLPGAVGHAAGVFTGALGAALALVGLAVIHAVTAGMSARGPILATAYVLLILFGFPVLLLALLGLAESLFRLRARRLGGAPPTS